MKHVHERTGKTFEIGRLVDPDGGTYDINVIIKFDEENDFEQNPVIVDYYFGDYDKNDTDYYIDKYLEKQDTLKSTLKFLEGMLLVDETFMDQENVTELKKTIQSVKDMTTNVL